MAVLVGLWLLDLAHEVGPLPHLGGVSHDLRSHLAEVIVVERGVLAGAGLDDHLDVAVHQLPDTVRRECDPVLGILHLRRDPHRSDGHQRVPNW